MAIWILVGFSEESRRINPERPRAVPIATVEDYTQIDVEDVVGSRFFEFDTALTLPQAIELKADLDKAVLLALAGEV